MVGSLQYVEYSFYLTSHLLEEKREELPSSPLLYFQSLYAFAFYGQNLFIRTTFKRFLYKYLTSYTPNLP
jgi:hypothetical protein